jgi:hypothetical protein
MPNDEASALQREVMFETFQHLLRNPDAKDTAAGIRRWWIARGEERFTEGDVQSALSLMVRCGWMLETRIAGTVLYSTTRAGLSEFRARTEETRYKDE